MQKFHAFPSNGFLLSGGHSYKLRSINFYPSTFVITKSVGNVVGVSKRVTCDSVTLTGRNFHLLVMQNYCSRR